MGDGIYNWLCSYFKSRVHYTTFLGVTSSSKEINASLVQGSVIGPSSFSVAASDLKPMNDGFFMFKFADDIDLITILEQYEKIKDEVDNIEVWAKANNLVLNKSKTKEIIFRTGRVTQLPTTTEGIDRVDSTTKLGVVMMSSLSMKDHVNKLMTGCASMLYPMNILRAQGLQQDCLQEVFRAKVLSRIMYASSAWWGLAKRDEINRINSFIKRAKKLGYYPQNGECFEELCREADARLFARIKMDHNHVLNNMIPKTKPKTYNLRLRSHNFVLPVKDDRNFINRVLYHDIY